MDEAQPLPSRKPTQSEALILGNGGSLLGRDWAAVPRDRVFIFGVNQSWRVVPDADAHFANDADQFDFANPTAAGFGGREYYKALAARRCSFHSGCAGADLGVHLHRHDELKFSRHPFRKRVHGANRVAVPLSKDGGFALKVGVGYSGSSAYVALQLAAAAGFERIWCVGFDMDDRKFDGAYGWTGFGKKHATNTGAWSNSPKLDAVWKLVPKDVLERTRVIAPSKTTVLTVVPWPWEAPCS